MNRKYNCKKSTTVDHGMGLMLIAPQVLPKKADLRSGCSPVFNQGNEGSCTGHAGAGIMEFNQLAALRKHLSLDQAPSEFFADKFVSVSRQFIYANERILNGDIGEDAGAQISDCARALNHFGVCPETDWPYVGSNEFIAPSKEAYSAAAAHKISQYARLTSMAQMKGCLANGHPFMFGFVVYSSFESEEVAATGMVPMPQPDEQCMGGHAVMAVGYDDEMNCFIVRNSWGAEWGDKGYFYLPYAYMMNPDLAHDAWVIQK